MTVVGACMAARALPSGIGDTSRGDLRRAHEADVHVCRAWLVARPRAPARPRTTARVRALRRHTYLVREQRVRFDRGRESCCAEDAFVGHGFGFLSALRAPLPARPQTRRGGEAVACTSRRRVCQSAALHSARKARLPGTLAPWPHCRAMVLRFDMTYKGTH